MKSDQFNESIRQSTNSALKKEGSRQQKNLAVGFGITNATNSAEQSPVAAQMNNTNTTTGQPTALIGNIPSVTVIPDVALSPQPMKLVQLKDSGFLENLKS